MPDTIASEWKDLAALRKAWKRVRRNKGMAGGDGQTLEHFSADSETRLRRLARDLGKAYRPGPVRRLSIKKQSGGRRVLGIPCVRDRIAQAACAAALDKRLDPLMSHASFAYRRGRSVEHAAGLVLSYRLRGYRWVVDGDIEAYFDSIPHAGLVERLEDAVRCRDTMTVIGLWLRGWSRRGRGVAQGSPLSPLLANLYLNDLDHCMDRKQARLVRYADDFLILTRTRAAAEDAERRMAQELRRLGLEMHPDKTAIRSFREGLTFLGMTFRGASVERSPQEDEHRL